MFTFGFGRSHSCTLVPPDNQIVLPLEERRNFALVLLQDVQPDLLGVMHRVQESLVTLVCDDLRQLVNRVHKHHDRLWSDQRQIVCRWYVQILCHNSTSVIQNVTLAAMNIRILLWLFFAVCVLDSPFRWSWLVVVHSQPHRQAMLFGHIDDRC